MFAVQAGRWRKHPDLRGFCGRRGPPVLPLKVETLNGVHHGEQDPSSSTDRVWRGKARGAPSKAPSGPSFVQGPGALQECRGASALESAGDS